MNSYKIWNNLSLSPISIKYRNSSLEFVPLPKTLLAGTPSSLTKRLPNQQSLPRQVRNSQLLLGGGGRHQLLLLRNPTRWRGRRLTRRWLLIGRNISHSRSCRRRRSLTATGCRPDGTASFHFHFSLGDGLGLCFMPAMLSITHRGAIKISR